eukprot:365268-Chlamydomonas_euryale.AAC.7
MALRPMPGTTCSDNNADLGRRCSRRVKHCGHRLVWTHHKQALEHVRVRLQQALLEAHVVGCRGANHPCRRRAQGAGLFHTRAQRLRRQHRAIAGLQQVFHDGAEAAQRFQVCGSHTGGSIGKCVFCGEGEDPSFFHGTWLVIRLELALGLCLILP